MHTFNKQLVLSIMIIVGSAPSLCAVLDAAPVLDTPVQAVSLHNATAQSQSPAKTMSEATQQAKASEVLLGFGQENGERFMMTTPFTPQEIDTYPGYKNAFVNHAAVCLDSSNPHDVSAIAHLIGKYPDMGVYLNQVAENTGCGVNNTIRKLLNKTNRQPAMSIKKAIEIAKIAPIGIAQSHFLKGFKGSLNKAINPNFSAAYLSAMNQSTLQKLGINAGKILKDGVGMVKACPRTVISSFPRSVAVGIGSAAVTDVVLQEFDERIGDPLPLPKYDPKSRNIVRYSGLVLKSVVRNFVVPYLINAAVDSAISHIG